jgi:hypothetical protein
MWIPLTAVRTVMVGCGRVRDGDTAARRKTTNTNSRSAKSKGSVVRPPAMACAPVYWFKL